MKVVSAEKVFQLTSRVSKFPRLTSNSSLAVEGEGIAQLVDRLVLHHDVIISDTALLTLGRSSTLGIGLAYVCSLLNHLVG